MLKLSDVDLEEIGQALQDQEQYERCYLINEQAGEIVFWSSDSGIDGDNRIDLDDLDENLPKIDAVPSYVWYQDMVDFAEEVSDQQAAGGRRSTR